MAEPAAGIAGYALMGVGLSACFPLVVAASARGSGDAEAASIAMVSGAGYVGLTAGPAAIGLLSDAAGLRQALLLVVALALVASALAGAAARAMPAGPLPSLVACPRQEPTAPDTGRRLGRVDSFSDGLFSIAATLLVLSIDVPNVPEADLNGALDSLLPSLLAYFISFAVVGLFWLRHHEFFGRLQASDSRLAALNLVFLAFIALLPVPTEILGRYDNSTAPVVIYAVFILVLSVLLRALFHHARNARLFAPGPGGAGGQRRARSRSGRRSACRSRWRT